MSARSLARRRSIAAVVGAVERHHGSNDPRLPALRRDLRAAELAEHIRKVVDTAPSLTADQIELLRGLLPAPRDGGPSAA